MADGRCTVELVLDGEVGMFTTIRVGDYYTGPTEFTPSDEEQVVEVRGLISSRNIIIHPVPSTYGRVAWNGSELFIS